VDRRRAKSSPPAEVASAGGGERSEKHGRRSHRPERETRITVCPTFGRRSGHWREACTPRRLSRASAISISGLPPYPQSEFRQHLALRLLLDGVVPNHHHLAGRLPRAALQGVPVPSPRDAFYQKATAWLPEYHLRGKKSDKIEPLNVRLLLRKAVSKWLFTHARVVIRHNRSILFVSGQKRASIFTD
jgi:hypothetical protein